MKDRRRIFRVARQRPVSFEQTTMAVLREEAVESPQEVGSGEVAAESRRVDRLAFEPFDDGWLAPGRFGHFDEIERLLSADGPLAGAELRKQQALEREAGALAHLLQRQLMEQH